MITLPSHTTDPPPRTRPGTPSSPATSQRPAPVVTQLVVQQPPHYAWERGTEYGGAVTKGIGIFVPHDELGSISVDCPADTVWLPDAEPGATWGIHVAFMRPDQGIAPVPGVVPIDGFVLADGSVVLVLAGVRKLSDTEGQMMADAHRRINVRWDSMPAADRDSLRLTPHAIDENGDRTLWDVAVRRATASDVR